MSSWSDTLAKPQIHEVIRPTSWGRCAWTLLHCVSFAYPLAPTTEEKENTLKFVHGLRDVLPCPTCKEDFKEMLRVNPLERHLNSREAFARWTNGVHNQVNEKLGKPLVSFEESVSIWCQPRTQAAQVHDASSPPLLVFIAIFLSIALVLSLVTRK